MQETPNEGQAREAPPALDLAIDDVKLVAFIKAYIKNAKRFFNDEKHYDKRIEVNERFYFGRQVDPNTRTYKGLTGERTLKTYEKTIYYINFRRTFVLRFFSNRKTFQRWKISSGIYACC